MTGNTQQKPNNAQAHKRKIIAAAVTLLAAILAALLNAGCAQNTEPVTTQEPEQNTNNDQRQVTDGPIINFNFVTDPSGVAKYNERGLVDGSDMETGETVILANRTTTATAGEQELPGLDFSITTGAISVDLTNAGVSAASEASGTQSAQQSAETAADFEARARLGFMLQVLLGLQNQADGLVSAGEGDSSQQNQKAQELQAELQAQIDVLRGQIAALDEKIAEEGAE